MPVATVVLETTLALVQGARLMNTLVTQYQQGKLTDEQYLAKAASLRVDVQTTEREWQALEDLDAQRSA